MEFADEGYSSEEDFVEAMSFTCRTELVSDMSNVLSSLLSPNEKDDRPCTIEATSHSLNFVVTGRAKSTQARASLGKDLFDDYQIESDGSPIRLVLHLSKLIDCLLLFGSSDTITATISFNTVDSIFRVTLEDSGIHTTCNLTSLCVDEDDSRQTNFFAAFRESEEEWSILVKSEPLKEAMQELLDVSGAGSVRMELKRNGVNLSTMGVGECMCEIDIPRTSAAFLSFVRSGDGQGTVVWTYSLSSIHLGMKALGVAKETYIRINMEGMICIQHQVTTKDGRESFIDICSCADEVLDGGADPDQYARDE